MIVNEVFDAAVRSFGELEFEIELEGSVGFFGDDDENPSPEDVAKIGDRLTELDVEHEFHSYPRCGHAFQNFTNPQAYRAPATSDSFTKMIEWLSKNL